MKVQADAVGLIRTLVIIVVAYYAIRFVMRILLPFALTYMAKKAGQRMQNHMHNNHTQREDLVHDDGKIQIRKPKKSNQSNSDWDGEYVSYEEIKDE